MHPCSLHYVFFLHIVYPALLVIFTSVLCLIHSVSSSFVFALYLSATFPWSYHHLTESMTFVSFPFTVCLLAFVQFLKLIYLDFVLLLFFRTALLPFY